jgi:hypothetical protein
MAIDRQRARQYLKAYDFAKLFTQELGWDKYSTTLTKQLDGRTYEFKGVAEKRGVVILISDSIPEYAIRVKVDRLIAKDHFEHLIVFCDQANGRQVWQWFRKEPGKPVAVRTYHFVAGQSGELLIQKLENLAFTLEEEENLSLGDVTGRLRTLDVEKVTKKFYERFKTEHASFLSFVKGIPDKQMEAWYASVMVNRLMFLYFIQEKGFLDGDKDYLRNRLKESRGRKPDAYYKDFLCPLFFQGFARKKAERSTVINKLLGEIPYLNGGLFQPHQIEELHGKQIVIADTAFEKLFNFFKEYDWHLDERENRNDREINPDVLGYIFEKYINQKQMGAYYTKEDITEYIAQNTIIPFLLDEARKGCAVAFVPNGSVWRLLVDDPDRYIHDAMKKGADLVLPSEIEAGVADVGQRTGWNRTAPEEFALPTEIWREAIDRHQRYRIVKAKLAAGEVHQVNDLVTLNLNIRQFAQDVIQFCEGPELLRAVWKAIEKVSVLDPTCGSGAFLFAALNILKPLYEACLIRMQGFIEDNDTVRAKTPEETISELTRLGESSSLEFKSTARWNTKENRPDKAIEQVIIKTVAAFLNSKGGDLLIGIQDDGSLLGIEADQRLWKQEQRNRDTYENWLTGLLLGACGKQHAANLHISFARLDNKDICRVTVLPSATAVYVKVENLETLYVRAGNSTHALPVKEAVAYHQQRFTNFHQPPVEPGKSPVSKKYTDFRKVFEESKHHPKQDYFILKSIIVNNLFGVDIMEEAVEICKLRLFLKLVAQVESQERIEPLPDIDFNIRAGNTLVGYGRYEDVKKAVTSKFDFGDSMSRIEDKARGLDSAVEVFRKQQTQLDGTVTAEDKAELRRRFSELEAELNDYLSGEYGIKKSGVKQWRESHKPFHWFCDFHRIISSGGFDVIVGNPPWVEFSKVKDSYVPIGLSTLECNNLWAFVTERSLELLSDTGVAGLIVPMSLVCTERMTSVQRLVSDFGNVCLANIESDSNPGQLFDGVKQNVTILLAHRSKIPRIYTTKLFRFFQEFREYIFPTLQFTHLDRSFPIQFGFAKAGTPLELSILTRMFSKPSLAMSRYPKGVKPILVHRIAHYYIKCLDFVPYFKSGRDGVKKSEDYKEYHFAPPIGPYVAAINSSAFYLYWQAFFDAFKAGKLCVESFPLGTTQQVQAEMIALAERLMQDIKNNSTRLRADYKTTGKVEYDQFYPRNSKGVMDEIDQVLARHYNFTDEELDFIINYDIKYRLGADADGDGEE